MTPDDKRAAFAESRLRIDNLRAFHIAASSHAGRTSHRSAFMITDDRVAGAIIKLGQMAAGSRRLLGVALAIIKSMNPHAASRDWHAKLFESAATALSKPHVDVERATGPESCRWSDATTSYTTSEKLIVLETVHSLCDGWCGPGWAASDLAAELGVHLPEYRRPV